MKLKSTVFKGAAVALAVGIFIISGFGQKDAQASQPTAAATSATQGTASKPGDTIGAIMLAKVDQLNMDIVNLGAFCDGTKAVITPGNKMSVTCDVPDVVTKAYVQNGLLAANKITLNSEWKAITWGLSLNGQKIDLPAFGTFDSDVPVSITRMGSNRAWVVELDDLTPGKYQVSETIHIPDNFPAISGVSSTRPGDYENDFTFNIGSQNFATPCQPVQLSGTPSMVATPDAASTASALPDTSYLGISVRLTGCGEAVITGVLGRSPAEKGGLKLGDSILAVNGVRLLDVPGMRPVPAGSIPGQVVTYTIERDGAVMDVQITLGKRPGA